jgi:hypothetical protein
LPGFDYDDCTPLAGDSTRQTVNWRGRKISELVGRDLRLEFFIQNCDLYSFVAQDPRQPE